MRNIIAGCLLVMFVFAGCGSEKYWYNKEKTYSRARVDCRECIYQSQGEIIDAAIQEKKEYGNSPNVHETYRQTLFEKCMKDKGYENIWDYKLDYQIKKGYVTQDDDMYPIAGK